MKICRHNIFLNSVSTEFNFWLKYPKLNATLVPGTEEILNNVSYLEDFGDGGGLFMVSC